MKSLHLSKLVGLSALSIGLTVLPFSVPASAQNAPNTADSTTQVGDVNFNWGWLGLLGLLGLAGLGGKRRDEHIQHDRRVDPVNQNRVDPVSRVDTVGRADDVPRYRDPNI